MNWYWAWKMLGWLVLAVIVLLTLMAALVVAGG